MPELPEVETVMRGLAPWMAGARFVKVEQRRADLRFPFPPRFPERLEGRRVEELERRAKYILAHLEGGEVLVMHLGMSGRMLVAPAAVGAGDGGDRLLGRFLHNQGGPAPGEALPASPHDHVVFAMSSGARITFNDARRFGMMDLIEVGGLAGYRLFRDLGPEPLGPGLTADYLAKAAAGRAVDLKAFLLDQRTVAGIGNIYASEILHRCRLSPSRLAHTLALKDGRPAARTAALVDAIRAVLAEAIAAGGSTLRDYVHTDGELGYFQHAFRTYDRHGEPCPRSGCRGVIRRTVQAGRSTFHCPLCQR